MDSYVTYNLDLLKKLACDIPNPVRSFRLVSSVVYKRRVVSFGVNSLKTDPFQDRFKKNDQSIYLHAEVAAIKKALKRIDLDDLRKCDMFVARVKRKGPKPNEPYIAAMAKPCAGCARCIAEFGIRNVYYTSENEEVYKCI